MALRKGIYLMSNYKLNIQLTILLVNGISYDEWYLNF